MPPTHRTLPAILPAVLPSAGLLLLVLLVGACATTGQREKAPASGHKVGDLDTPHRGPSERPLADVTLEPLVHEEGSPGFAFLDGRTGESLSWQEVRARLVAADVVVVGESHDSPADHGLQARVVEALGPQGSVGVALEMVPRHLQATVERYNRGEIDEDGLRAALDWPKTWGWDFDLYRPIFQAGRKVSARFVGVNAPRDLVRALAKQGVNGLTPDQRHELPAIDLGDDVHRQGIEEVFRNHHPPTGSGNAFERFYAAQVLWDESMAEGALRAKDGVDRVVVLAGNGHVAGYRGIPNRILRRWPEGKLVTVVPLGTGDGEDAAAEARAAVAAGAGDIIAVRRPREVLSI